MGMKWIREQYNVPAFRGAKVIFDGQPGQIVSARETGHLRLQVINIGLIYVHPTDDHLLYFTGWEKIRRRG